MKRYRVFGHTTITVTTVVEVEEDEELTEEEIYERAQKGFGGIVPYAGNGGVDKLIGVDGSDDTIESDEEVEFDDYMEE